MKLPFENHRNKKKKTCFPISTRPPPGCYEINISYMCKFQILPNSKEHAGWFPRDPNERCGLSRWFVSSPLVFVGLPWSRFFLDVFVSKANGPQCSLGFPQRPKCQTSAWDLASALWQPLIDFAFCQVESTEVFGLVLEVRAFQFGERFFPWKGWFSKAKISLQKEHGMWVSLKLVRHEGVNRNSSNHIKWVWNSLIWTIVSWCLAKNARDRMTNDRHCQIATKVKAQVETTLPLYLENPKPPLYL